MPTPRSRIMNESEYDKASRLEREADLQGVQDDNITWGVLGGVGGLGKSAIRNLLTKNPQVALPSQYSRALPKTIEEMNKAGVSISPEKVRRMLGLE